MAGVEAVDVKAEPGVAPGVTAREVDEIGFVGAPPVQEHDQRRRGAALRRAPPENDRICQEAAMLRYSEPRLFCERTPRK